ncbi:MAG TPA: bifunctional DNA-formamidopyrimidine glycosylase/DNA-(apurinic or apyrimidinic site) lyase [Dehalococcoidia bacterium]|nr:bifunctional DNA-formamidopyrimidine glycosylase/DNA-(apurinic or apyrimidinic site) lyase [Dehalococcoidia bacterium]
MPELPEVETVRRDLEDLVSGRRIIDLNADASTLPLLAGPTVTLDELRNSLVGRTIRDIGRIGKYLLFTLDDGRTLVVHLRMTGRLIWRSSKEPEEPYERARLVLDNDHDLRWADLRKFGTWRLIDDVRTLEAKLGPEPIAAGFTLSRFRRALGAGNAPIKSVLLDQRRLAGIGNIYADEALFEARIRPDTPASALSRPASKRLFHACREVLEQGIRNRGASFQDYVDAQGEPGRNHIYVQVFRRTGEPCYRCGSTIQRIVVGGRSTHFCGRCQRRPRRPPSKG